MTLLKTVSLAAVVAITGLLGATPVMADLKVDMAKCAAIAGSLDRLSCFDQITKENNLSGPQPQTVVVQGVGKWTVNQDKNPLDDSQTVTLALQATDGQSKFGSDVMLLARCKSNKTNVFIVWGDYLGTDGDSGNNRKEVTVRVGESKASLQRWDVSTDNEATFSPDPINLLKAMVQSNQLVAQVTPYDAAPNTALFDTTGLGNALKPLMKVCGWSM